MAGTFSHRGMLGFDTVATKSHHHQPVNATTLVLGWKLVTAFGVSPYDEGEKAHAHELIGGNVWEDDCVLFDRGYNDPRIIAWSIAKDSHFVIRVTVGSSKAAQDFGNVRNEGANE